MRQQTFVIAGRWSLFQRHGRPARSPLHLKVLSTILALGSSFALIGASARASALETRPRLDLNGVWDFRMDPKDEGNAQSWFNADVNYPDKIKVPGNWQAQGFGEPRNHLRHDYQGTAWYRRIVKIPADWSGKRIWIHLGGVTALGDVFVNGKKVGFVEHFLTPYEFDITDAARPNTDNVISCCVDSVSGCHDPHRGPVVRPGPVGMFNFWGHWGGLYRPVWLEARSDPSIDTLFVTPDMTKGIAQARVVLRRSTPGTAGELKLVLSVTPAKGGPTSSAEGKVCFRAGQVESDEALIDVKVKEMHPWSPEDPFLYHVQAALLEKGKKLDAKHDRFGMREITTGKGGTLLLNGRPYFIRGLGDDYVEAITGTLVPDTKVFIDRIKLCKRYGYNGFRYLGHTPAKEVFDAADEVGFLILAEAEAYWNAWPRQNEIIPLYKKMVPQIIREHHNHPSWYAWSGGNEFAVTPEWMDYINYAHDTFRKMDPTRFFIASEGTGIFPMDIVTGAGMFGGSQGATAFNQPFLGMVSEAAYFKQCLSGPDIAKLSKPIAGYPDTVKVLKPAGYWRLNEPAIGKVSDSSGNGRDGVCEGTMPAVNLGQPSMLPASDAGGAVRFGVTVPALSLKSVAPSTFAKDNEPFSLSIWIKPDGFGKGDYGTPFAYGAASPNSAVLLSMDGGEGTGKVLIGLWQSNVAQSSRSLRAGEWNHVGVTYNGTHLKLYVNGEPDTITSVHLMTDPRDGRIGNLVQESSAVNQVQDKPHIWHEFNNVYAGSLPDLTIVPKYTGVIRDNNCVAFHIKEIADYGLTERYPDIRKRSIDFFYLYLKDFYEAARKSPTLDGYHYWLMADLPGGVEGDPSCLGIFNMFYEPEKFPNPKPVLRFNRETVLLVSADGNNRVLGASESKPISISVSHYGNKPIKNGKLRWQLKHGSKIVDTGAVEGINMDIGKVEDIGKVSINPGHLDRAAKLSLEARLDSAACTQDNEWDFWAFPAKKRDFSGSSIVNLTKVAALNERYGADSAIQPHKTRVVVTDKLDASVLDYVNGGGNVVVLTEAAVLTHPVPIAYWPQALRSVGYVVEDHPAINDFPNDGFCTYQFYRLFGTAVDSLDLTTKGSSEREKFIPAVWGMKADFDPAMGFEWSDPRNRTKFYRCGLVCEGRIGMGKILTCSLRVLTGIRNGLPEAGYLVDCLVDYALSDPFAPKSEPMTVEDAKRVFKL